MIREAIILAGGLGTRLKETIPDMPKPMAPIGGKPFLWYVMEYLHQSGIRKVIMSVGHKHETIVSHFGNRYKETKIDYAIETEPLGTGGGIRHALSYVKDSEVAIINGDTFFPVPLAEMHDYHKRTKAHLTVALKPMEDYERYGTVVVEEGRIIRFEEKKPTEYGHINGGIYIARKHLFKDCRLDHVFSFENDFLSKETHRLHFAGYPCDQYFIDIGIPEDYERAMQELPLWILYGH